jgi:hypothetical protein
LQWKDHNLLKHLIYILRTPNAVETFLKNLKETIKYSRLKKSDIMSSSEPTDTEGDAGLQGKPMNLAPAPAATGTSGRSGSAPQRGGFRQDVYNFADGGQVILQWPEAMSPDDIEEFEEWIELQKKKIKKAASRGSEPQQ